MGDRITVTGNCGVPAIFFDRDGTLNSLVWHEYLAEWGPPFHPDELVLRPGVVEAIRTATALGYLSFAVTNQPDAAKGKATLDEIEAVRIAFLNRLKEEEVPLIGYEHCLCHPQAVRLEYRKICPRRKPATGMIDVIVERHQIDRSRSWMIGDRVSDIICGRTAGLKTIAVYEPHTLDAACNADPDFAADDLSEVVAILLKAKTIEV